MAGHSKWNNIKNRKGAADQRRAKEFSQVAKLIRIAVKEGKSDNPDFNPRLRTALDKARAANMPKEKISKAIERGLGRSASGASLQEVLYEGYGPAGVAIIVQVITDNPTRTSSEIKFVFSRHNGSLAGPHAAQFLFSRSEESQTFIPLMPQELSPEDAGSVRTLLDAFLELEDVEEVFHTAVLDESESDDEGKL